MTGPTVAGSIVAKLRVDSGAWDAELAAAAAKAEALGKVDPKIKIDVDSAAAIAKMAAVDAAEKRVDIANQALRLSYLRLDEAQSKGGISAARLAALHLAASRAEATHESATKRLAAAQLALAAAEDEEEHASSKANATHSAGLTRWKLIAAAIAGLIPLMAPLAGYAVGVAGALAGMGAAGVLAVIGVKNAMEEGNAVGQSYSSGLQSLKGDLNGLASTSANAMLGSFRQAVALINADMPSLNSQIGVFSQMLGTVGNTVLQGVLNSFRVLNPLFVQAGQYVEELANGFKKWTADGGLQKFGQYAQQVLPQVAATLGSLAAGALHLVEALAPVGTTILGGLKAFGDVLNAIPANTLANLAVGGGAFFLAFKGWAALTPIIQGVAVAIGAVGAAEDLALGPIGLVVAGVTAAAAIFAVSATSTNTAAVAINGYTSAVQQDTGAIGENVRAHAAKALADAGAVDGAQRLGISNKTLLDATLGVASAQDQVNQKIKAAKSTYDNHGGVVQVVSKKQTEMFDAVSKVSGAVKTNSAEIGDATRNYQAYSSLMATTASSQTTEAQATNTLTAALDAQTSSTNLLKTAFDLLNGTNLSVAQSQTAMAAANNQVATSFTTNGLAIDGNSAAAVANQQAIQSAATAAQANAAAIATQTGSTDEGTRAFGASKTALEDQLAAQGNLTPAVQAYIDKLYQIPPELATKLSVDNAAANAAIADTASRLAALSGAIASVGAGHLATTGNGYVPSENGNMFVKGAQQVFADGGFPTDIYQGRPGGIHKFAEQQTGWEAYISGKPGQEARNTGIALKALARLGYQMPVPQSAQTVQSAPVTVSLEGATIMLSVDGQQMTGVITQQILKVNDQQGTALSNGVRPLA